MKTRVTGMERCLEVLLLDKRVAPSQGVLRRYTVPQDLDSQVVMLVSKKPYGCHGHPAYEAANRPDLLVSARFIVCMRQRRAFNIAEKTATSGT